MSEFQMIPPELRHLQIEGPDYVAHLWVLDHGDGRAVFAASGYIEQAGGFKPLLAQFKSQDLKVIFEARKAYEAETQAPLGRRPNDARDVAMALAAFWATHPDNPEAVKERQSVRFVADMWAGHDGSGMDESHVRAAIKRGRDCYTSPGFHISQSAADQRHTATLSAEYKESDIAVEICNVGQPLVTAFDVAGRPAWLWRWRVGDPVAEKNQNLNRSQVYLGGL